MGARLSRHPRLCAMEGRAPSTGPWAVPVEPTTLVALWPHEVPPTRTEVLAALSAAAGGAAAELGEPESRDGGVLWSSALRVPGLHETIVLWCEATRTLSPEEIDDIRALGCEWAIGVQTLLDPADALTSFASLMRLLWAAFDEIPAILDAGGSRWHVREASRPVFGDPGIEPPPEALWIIHAVCRSARSHRHPAREGRPRPGQECAWLHTHGLRRAGLPELEMIEVEPDLVQVAAELINALAARFLEEPPPAPGEALDVGAGLQVTLQPWREVAPYVERRAPGGLEDRRGADNAHAGPGAVVCALRPEGTLRRTWRWPREVLLQIEHGDGLLYLSRRATERAAARAQATWAQLAEAFVELPEERRRADGEPDRAGDPAAARFMIKAGLASACRPEGAEVVVSAGPVDGAEGEREHMWFVVQRFEAGRARGMLLNEPALVAGLRRGDVVWIDRDMVSDWSVITPEGAFGPDELEAMRLALRTLGRDGEAGAGR